MLGLISDMRYGALNSGHSDILNVFHFSFELFTYIVL